MKNNLNEIANDNGMMKFEKTDDIFTDMQEIIETTQRQAYKAVNTVLVQ